jgi:hypothetical protein
VGLVSTIEGLVVIEDLVVIGGMITVDRVVPIMIVMEGLITATTTHETITIVVMMMVNGRTTVTTINGTKAVDGRHTDMVIEDMMIEDMMIEDMVIEDMMTTLVEEGDGRSTYMYIY